MKHALANPTLGNLILFLLCVYPQRRAVEEISSDADALLVFESSDSRQVSARTARDDPLRESDPPPYIPSAG